MRDSPKAFITPSGKILKEIRRDSFGLPYDDSLPDLRIPIGFAGGIEDPLTGLVRFGWRDYDPAVGRFTAPDPARDLRGDGDRYDYCVDDPVSRLDPWGLFSYTLLDIAPPFARQAAELRKREAELEKSRRQANENLTTALINKTSSFDPASVLVGRLTGTSVWDNINIAGGGAKLLMWFFDRPQKDFDKIDKALEDIGNLPSTIWQKVNR